MPGKAVPYFGEQKKYFRQRNSLALMSFSFPPLVRGAGGIDGLEYRQCTNIFDSTLKIAHMGSRGEVHAGKCTGCSLHGQPLNFLSCSNHKYSNMIQHTAERQPPKSPGGGLKILTFSAGLHFETGFYPAIALKKERKSPPSGDLGGCLSEAGRQLKRIINCQHPIVNYSSPRYT